MPNARGRDLATVTDIRRCGPAMRRRTIVLDGDGWRDVPAGLLALLGRDVADEVDVPELTARIEAIEPGQARERAIRLITARERSHAGLVDRLVQDGFDVGVATATVEDLARIGLVDDERFAHALARTLARARGAGRSRIARELRQAGVSESLVEEALEAALDVDQECAAADLLAGRAATRAGATVDRVASRLVRRGYRAPVALAAARKAIEDAGIRAEHGSLDPEGDED
jgi:regulatory protein